MFKLCKIILKKKSSHHGLEVEATTFVSVLSLCLFVPGFESAFRSRFNLMIISFSKGGFQIWGIWMMWMRSRVRSQLPPSAYTSLPSQVFNNRFVHGASAKNKASPANGEKRGERKRGLAEENLKILDDGCDDSNTQLRGEWKNEKGFLLT